ncbi:MAG: PAS-domain containing protein [Holosporaceae bacterium]|jgi:signal transduction histidine kinase/PAS domain-containing protein|nr:PAS-domain containing protein [Holosporaceae bacterium]
MKTWYKTELLGSFLVIFGGISLIFSNSSVLTISCFMLASIILLRCVYRSRYDVIRFQEALCHYQAALSSSCSGWISWNSSHEYIGSSQKFRAFFGIKHNSSISISEIIRAIDRSSADQLSFLFGQMAKTGASFRIVVSTLSGLDKIEISGSKMIINRLETLVLWCSDISESSQKMNNLYGRLNTAETSAAEFRETLDMIPLPVWKRNNDLEITYCNNTYANATGNSVDRILSNNIPLIPGNLFGQGHSLAENAKKCNRMQTVSQFTTIDGVRKKLSVHEIPLPNGNMLGFATDITSEENLTLSLDRVITANYEVLENLSTAIAIFGENTRLVFFNSAYQRLLKLEPNWLHSKPTYMEILDERRSNRQLPEHADFQAFKKSQLALFCSITAPQQELTHLPNGNTLRTVIAPYPLGGLLFIFEDVTDSLTLQRQNNTLQAVQKETIDHLQEGIAVYGSNNRLKIVNNAILRIWHMENRQTSDLKGMHLSEMLDIMKSSIDYGDNWRSYQENTISCLTDRIAKSGRLLKKDNSVVMFSYIPLPDGAHMLSYTDITDSYMVEKAIMEKNQALKAAQKLRYEFIYGISTELKEPLNALIGFSELLLNQYYGMLNEKQTEYCRYILSSSNQLYQLINNLLEMVSIDTDSTKLDMSTFSIYDAIKEVITNVEKRAHEKNIEIITHFDDTKIKFNGDRKCIKQALFNVLINAIQFTPINGKIDLKMILDGNNVKIIIKDEAIGSNKNNSPEIPKRSYKKNTSKYVEFNNVSMPLVRSILELHGGTLGVNTDKNGNTCVICSLPIHISSHPEKKQPSSDNSIQAA